MSGDVKYKLIAFIMVAEIAEGLLNTDISVTQCSGNIVHWGFVRISLHVLGVKFAGDGCLIFDGC